MVLGCFLLLWLLSRSDIRSTRYQVSRSRVVCGHETDKVNDPCVFFVFSCLLDVFEGGTMYTYVVIFLKT